MKQKSLQYELENAIKKIGRLCLEKRHKMNMSINKLSAISNISLGAISTLEKGENIPSLVTLLSVTNVLHLENEVFAILRNVISNKKKLNTADRLKKALLEYGIPPEEVSAIIIFIQYWIDKHDKNLPTK